MPLKPSQSLMTLFLKSLSKGDKVYSVDEFPRKIPPVFPAVQDDLGIISLSKRLPGT